MRYHHQRRQPRRGNILPLVAVSVVGLCGFVALAVDLGMLAVAKTQAQNAADIAAMAGARAIDGSAAPDTAGATTVARKMARANKVLSAALTDAEVAVRHGSYHYDTSTETFYPQFPPKSPDKYNLTEVTVTHDAGTAFARVFGLQLMKVKATATAAHRPKDVSIVLDFSGSMNDESDLWHNLDYLGSVDDTSNSAEAVFPKFGHYSATSTAKLQYTGSDSRLGKSNITSAASGVPAIVGDFYQHAWGATAKSAFTKAADTQADTPGGDDYLKITANTGSSYASTVNGISTAAKNIKGFEANGYKHFTGKTFNGYTEGPRYWGRTFFVWPPDPTNDWREKFFLKAGGSHPNFGGPLDDNTKLWDGSGNWRLPVSGGTTNYVINYKAILAWVKASGVFPAQLRAGKVLYYDAIPDDVPAAAYTWTTLNSNITNQNQRFWKEYIDYALGVYLTPYYFPNLPARPGSTSCSYGPDFAWGTVKVSAKPAAVAAYDTAAPTTTFSAGYDAVNNYITISGASGSPQFVKFSGDSRVYAVTANSPSTTPTKIKLDASLAVKITTSTTISLYNAYPAPFMNYADNPKRPRHRMWFGPMTMIQFMADMGILPGTAHDVQMYAARLGMQGALEDIRNNHPNTLVSMILFNRPAFKGEPAEAGRFSKAAYGLSSDYTGMINALWFPPNSATGDVKIWDANGMQTPRAAHDYMYNTCPNYGLMLAYNQFSSDSTLRSQALGGDGRKGTQRVVILQSDGMANVEAVASFTNKGAGQSYYNVKPGDAVTAGNDPSGGTLAVARRLCALTTDGTNGPGFSTTRKPVHIHCIAFGAIIEPTAEGTEPAAVMKLLGDVAKIGGTGFPSSVTDTGSPYAYKLCTGSQTQRQTKLRTAYTKIMDEEIAISLVK